MVFYRKTIFLRRAVSRTIGVEDNGSISDRNSTLELIDNTGLHNCACGVDVLCEVAYRKHFNMNIEACSGN